MFKRKLLNLNKKKILKILLIIFIILLFLSKKVYADDSLTTLIDSPQSAINAIIKFLVGLLNGYLGARLYIIGALVGLIVIVVYIVLCIFLYLIGSENFFVSPADIFIIEYLFSLDF